MMKLWPNPKNKCPLTVGRWLRLNVLLLGLVLLLSVSFPVSTLSQKLNDFYFHLRGPQPVSSNVALVLIDDASLAQYGRWPWSRHLLAQLIHVVSERRPAAIGIDVLLSEPQDEANDAELARAIHSALLVVLASKISGSPDRTLWVDPLPRFAEAAAGVGHVQAIVDFDGLCRSIPLEEPAIDGPRPAFSVKLAELLRPQLTGLEHQTDSRTSGIDRLVIRPLLIDYRRQFEPGQDHPPFVTVSAADLLSGKSTMEFQGKAVLVGFGGSEISDRLFTPVSGQLPMPGVEINANALDMLLSGKSLSRIGLAAQILVVVFVSAVSLWLVVRFPAAQGLFMVTGILVSGYFAAFFLFLHFHLLLSYAPLLVAGVLAAPIAQLEHLLIVDREVTSRLRQLRSAIKPHTEQAVAGEAAILPASSHLHWKLAALKELQAELSSLYTFNQTLLETMREGLAVYAADGTLRFSNETWNKLAHSKSVSMDTLAGLVEVAGGWRELASTTTQAPWAEREVALGEELWLFRAVRLPWTSFADSGALLVMAEDITARRQRDQARSEALSFVTHELRTPLIAIQGFAELQMRYPGSPASHEAPGTIFRETNRLVAMINTYLEVLRLDAGARPLRRARVDISRMVEHVEKVVRPLAASVHIRVKVEIDSAEEYLLCDETLVSGALLNLLSNAIKYGERGSDVLLRVSSHPEAIEFEVRNFGPAIPSAELDQIFGRFYRPSHSESIPGWGLGLSFVRRICQQHGGAVQVSSNETSGTSFIFTLPREVKEVSEVAL
jgi:signal transduction histidine kinase